MAFAISRKEIHCPNCKFEGKAKIKGSGGGAVLLLLGLFIVSFFVWPLFILTAAMLLWLIFKPAKQICPKCSFATPIPLEQFRAQQKTS